MSRLQSAFQGWQSTGHKALIPYVVAGDPEPGHTVALMHAMVKAGADILELGVPFSDPMADGPVIAAAHERALRHGVSLRDVLAMVREFREQDKHTPVVLMGYLNPIEAMGYATFAHLADQSGVDGVLTVDLPPEEAQALTDEMSRYGLDPIYLLAPTTTVDRARKITAAARGYVYYVSLNGVTGAANLDIEEVQRRIDTLRNISHLPIGVGFGIKDAAMARAIAGLADAVVVGSVLVQSLAHHATDPQAGSEAVCALLRGMRASMDAVMNVNS